MNPTSAHHPMRRHFIRAGSGDPLPERPLDDGHAEEERADGEDRGVHLWTASDRSEREKEREDDETEAGQREQRPAVARHAQRDREAERREKTIGGAETSPGDHSQDREQDERPKALEVDRCDSYWIRAADDGPV